MSTKVCGLATRRQLQAADEGPRVEPSVRLRGLEPSSKEQEQQGPSMEARPDPRHSREPSVGSTLPSFMYSILHGDAEWKGCTVAGNPLQLTSPPSTRAGIVCGRHRRAAAPLDGAQVERLHALLDGVARGKETLRTRVPLPRRPLV